MILTNIETGNFWSLPVNALSVSLAVLLMTVLLSLLIAIVLQTGKGVVQKLTTSVLLMSATLVTIVSTLALTPDYKPRQVWTKDELCGKKPTTTRLGGSSSPATSK